MASGRTSALAALTLVTALSAATARADEAAAIVQKAVNAELAANRDDHSLWRYREREDGGEIFYVVETHYGSVKRHIEDHGRPSSPEVLAADDAYNQRFIHDASLQAKQRRDSQHDDKSATELLNEMPTAFVWKIENEGPDSIALSYRPNPDFSPPNMESHVMSAMSGTLVVSKPGH